MVGRADFQVKVRGYRIELGEVESALHAHADVGDAVVVARDDGTGFSRLAAYVVPAPGAAPDWSPIRAESCASVCREYMLPSSLTVLEVFSAHARTARWTARRCPAPARGASEQSRYVAPRTSTEAALSEIWSELLEVERGRVDEDFLTWAGTHCWQFGC